MMQYTSADNLIEACSKIAHLLQRKLVDLEVVELVFALQPPGMLYAGCAEIDAGDASRRPANGIFCGLQSSATGDEYGVVLAVGTCGPEEVKVCPAAFVVLPPLTIGLQVIDGWRIRIPVVEGLDFHRRAHTFNRLASTH